MTRIYDVSSLDERVETTIFVDSPTHVGKCYLLGVFESGLFECVFDDCDEIVTLDLSESKVYPL